MKIKKILNNNVVVTIIEKNKEIIVMGKGLAFGLKAGDDIDESRIDKTFFLSNNSEMSRFKKLLSEVSEDSVEMTEEYVNFAKEELGKQLHDSIYITLTDHINIMLERAKIHAYIKNTMLWDIKRLYQDEFKVSQKIVEKFNQRIGSVYDDNEAASITLHLINAEMETDFSSTMTITKIISEILEIVKNYFQIEFDEESFSYYRFVIHIRFFAQRLLTQTTYSDINDIDFLVHIQKKYEEAYECVQMIEKYVFYNYQYQLSDEERMYLTIHITKVVKDSYNL